MQIPNSLSGSHNNSSVAARSNLGLSRFTRVTDRRRDRQTDGQNCDA